VAAFFENIGHIVLMLLLLACSAFLSGSETAFFSLSMRQAKILEGSAHALHKLAGQLINNPKRLLTSILFGNMAVNVLFFALASVLSVNLTRQVGRPAGVTVVVGTFLALVLFGEMLPKSLAYSNSVRFCIAAAPVCFVCMRILSPVLRIIELALVAPALRLLTGPVESDGPDSAVTAEQLKTLIEASRQRGLIGEDENQLFAEVIELGFLKVRHVMRPRVDIIACDLAEPPENIQQLMTENNLTKIPVYTENIDNIVGYLHQRNLLLGADVSVAKLLGKVDFVPEQKTVESLLEFFRQSGTDAAIVVDEYGGIAGVVSVEDVVEELIGPIEPAARVEPIEQVGPLHYRLAANLAIHDWAQTFGIGPGQTRLATVGGLVTALLGKIPKTGDVAYLRNLKFTVERVRKRRIETLLLSLEPVSRKRETT
jgi:putative hemolysin